MDVGKEAVGSDMGKTKGERRTAARRGGRMGVIGGRNGWICATEGESCEGMGEHLRSEIWVLLIEFLGQTEWDGKERQGRSRTDERKERLEMIDVLKTGVRQCRV